MSSPSQSEFEDYVEQFDMDRVAQENENYNQENDRYLRRFDNYNELIEMITYIINDHQFILERERDIMRAIENLIKRKKEILENKTIECVDMCYCADHNTLASICKCVCKCTEGICNCAQELVSEQDKIKGKKKLINNDSSSSSKIATVDKLQGINLPYYDGNDIYDFTSMGLIELETCLLHYKGQLETSILKELETETREAQIEILEQIYTILQGI